MILVGGRSSILLLAGDVASFAASLYLALWLRYGAPLSLSALVPYLLPFALLFALWLLVFYAFGLYGKRLALFPSRMPDALIGAHITNIALAAIFFFLVPVFGIAPKTILLLYLAVSLALIFLWRTELYPRISTPRSREGAALLAAGPDADELLEEIHGNARYGIEFRLHPDAPTLADADAVKRLLDDARVSLVVLDTRAAAANRLIPLLYGTGRARQTVPFEDLYEEVFDRVPLSTLGQAWLLEHAALSDSTFYRVMKRLIDIIGGLVMAFVTLAVAPFIFIADRIEGPGPLIIRQERLGRRGSRITAYKFRSMQKNLPASNQWTHEGENRVTNVGAFLRLTSLDEFPQFVNILAGELSLVGPRNDIAGLGERLSRELPYYDARYLVTPGITGWAQVNQQYEPGNLSPQSVEETKVRLAYDFYYLKHRSLGLDILIALKTVKRMFFRVSS